MVYTLGYTEEEKLTVCFAAADIDTGVRPTAYCIGGKSNGLFTFSEPLRERDSLSLPFIMGLYGER